MTSNIVPSIIKSYQGKSIRIREDKYVCLTDMASASGKLLANWTRTDKSKSYLGTLSAITQKSIIELIEVGEGGLSQEQGTWAHPDIAIGGTCNAVCV